MSAHVELEPIVIENANIKFRNFSGKQGLMNPQGRRNFVVFIEDDVLAESLVRDGWNVKWLKPLEEGDPRQPILPITVSYSYKPPEVFLITSRGRTKLGEKELDLLDWADIKTADMTIRPYHWTFGDAEGISARLQKLYVTIREDPLERKYQDVPDSAQNCIGPDCDLPPL